MTNDERWYSVDTLRGLCMICILGFTDFLQAVIRLFPGGRDSWLHNQFYHVSWEGVAIEDLFFPTFLFVAGVMFPLSLKRLRERDVPTGRIVRKILLRAAILFALGLCYVGFLKLDFAHMEFTSVLGRIGVAWAVSALVFLFVRGRIPRVAILLAILAVHAVVSATVHAPDHPDAGVFTPEGSFSFWLDRVVLGFRTQEGIFGYVTSVATAMLGMFAGEWLLAAKELKKAHPSVPLALAGVALLAAGYALSPVVPIVKQLWSASYVLVAGGWSSLALAFLYWLVDERRLWREGSIVFRVVGMNSIFLYVAPHFIKYPQATDFFVGGLRGHLPVAIGDVVWWATFICLNWFLAAFLYRQRIFIKV